jgi:prepilin-type N-terminal cleavage/methylation domain-containing protein
MEASMPRRAAFTLIELMIAMTLSLVVVYTAFAGLRVATQSITVCNRMSAENALMRTGFFSALDDLDHWTSYDDPSPSAPHPLREIGMPFAPMRYDADFRLSEPKSWWRDFGYSSNSKRWGSYDLMARVGHAEPQRAWLPRQQELINQTIGHYGLVDYLPGNTIFSYFGADGLVPPEFVLTDQPMDAGPNPRAYTSQRPSGTADNTPKDIWALTHHTAYCVTTNEFYRNKGYNRFRFHEGAPAPWRYRDMQSQCREVSDLLPQRPQTWPGLTTDMRRYTVWSHNMDVCQVQIVSPLTGESTRFSFWGIGTTLRGARMQRGLDTYRNGLLP